MWMMIFFVGENAFHHFVPLDALAAGAGGAAEEARDQEELCAIHRKV